MNHVRDLFIALGAAATIWYVACWSVTAPPVPSPAQPVPVAPVAPAKRTLLVYSTKNCAPCAALAKTLADPSVVEALKGWTVHTIKHSGPRSKLGIKAYPTTIAQGEPGKELARFEGSKSPEELIAWLAAVPVSALIGASVGGQVGPDGKTEIACDLPGDLHRHNVSSRGQGCCVQTSIGHSARWQNVPALIDFQTWVQKKGLPGGAYPGAIDQRIPACAKDRGFPTPEYIQVQGGDLEILKAACKAGRMPGVTYSKSPTGRYGGQRISHMVSLVSADDNWFVVLDNNFPGASSYEWMSAAEFAKAYAPGWAVILLNPPPPPPPKGPTP